MNQNSTESDIASKRRFLWVLVSCPCSCSYYGLPMFIQRIFPIPTCMNPWTAASDCPMNVWYQTWRNQTPKIQAECLRAVLLTKWNCRKRPCHEWLFWRRMPHHTFGNARILNFSRVSHEKMREIPMSAPEIPTVRCTFVGTFRPKSINEIQRSHP